MPPFLIETKQMDIVVNLAELEHRTPADIYREMVYDPFSFYFNVTAYQYRLRMTDGSAASEYERLRRKVKIEDE